MTNQEYIEYATDKWMELVEKKSKLSKQDLYTMETLITYIIEGALQFKEQQLIDGAVEWLNKYLFYLDKKDDIINDCIKAMKGEQQL